MQEECIVSNYSYDVAFGVWTRNMAVIEAAQKGQSIRNTHIY